MSKNQCSNFKAYIFGKNKNFFIKELKNKINYECFDDLKQTLKKIILDIKLKKKKKNTKPFCLALLRLHLIVLKILKIEEKNLINL